VNTGAPEEKSVPSPLVEMQEKIEDNKCVIRSGIHWKRTDNAMTKRKKKDKKDRQCNGQKKEKR